MRGTAAGFSGERKKTGEEGAGNNSSATHKPNIFPELSDISEGPPFFEQENINRESDTFSEEIFLSL